MRRLDDGYKEEGIRFCWRLDRRNGAERVEKIARFGGADLRVIKTGLAVLALAVITTIGQGTAVGVGITIASL